MRQFISFEDDWDALARLRPEDLVPYRTGMRSYSTPGDVPIFLFIDRPQRVMEREPPDSG
jgi:hypothetical protein